MYGRRNGIDCFACAYAHGTLHITIGREVREEMQGGLFYAMCPLSLTSTSLSLSLFGGSREFDYPPPTTRFCISIYICDVHLRTCVDSRRPAQTHPAGPSDAQIAPRMADGGGRCAWAPTVSNDNLNYGSYYGEVGRLVPYTNYQ